MIIYILLFIVGSVLGSFYLVLGLRGGQGKSIVTPRSHCDNCGKSLKWYHLIPVFSYIFLRGKCAYCQQKISIMNLFTELFTGLLFAMSYYVFGYSYDTLISLVIISVLVITFISDFNYLIILDSPIIIGSILVVTLNCLKSDLGIALKTLSYGVLLFLIMLLIKFIGDKIFKRESLGGGDIKISIFIGILLGIKLGLISLVISCFLALPYALYVAFRQKEKEVPFGPFLITAAYITFLYSENITTFIDSLLYF